MASFPLHCNVYNQAGGVLGAIRLANQACNFIPTATERQRDLQLISYPIIGRFIFPAGTDVRDDYPTGGSVPLTTSGNEDVIECPIGSVLSKAFHIIWVVDSYPATAQEYRTAFVTYHRQSSSPRPQLT